MASNQRGMSCDTCNQWTLDPCRISKYQVMNEADIFVWICPRCLLDELPFSHVELDETVSSSSRSLLNLSNKLEDATAISSCDHTRRRTRMLPLSGCCLKFGLLNVGILLRVTDEVSALLLRHNYWQFAKIG